MGTLLRLIVLQFCGTFFSSLFLNAQEIVGANALVGGKSISGNSGSSKFTEYRDVPAGMFSKLMFLNLTNADGTKSLTVSGSNIGQSDQTFEGRYASSRDWKLKTRWDQVPHDYTNSARTIFGGAGSGILQIPAEIRSRLRTLINTDINPQRPGVQFDSVALATLVNSMARPVSVMSDRDRWNVDTKVSPMDELSFGLSYTSERRSGTKPLGSIFYFQTPTEIIEPTNYRTQEVTGTLEYTTKVWTAQLGYSASLFKNDVQTLVWDNPFRESDVLAGTSRGRMALYPDNWMHRFSFSGAANLPLATRFVASASYSLRRQDDSFIPFTINRAVDTLPTLPALPAQSFNGRVANTFLNAFLITRVLSPVSFSLRYRMFDYNNQSPSLLFRGYVDKDNLITSVVRRNIPVSYRRTNISAEAATRMWNSLSMRGAYERENWNRDYGEAEVTHENMYRLVVDYTPLQLVTLRSTWLYGDKEVPSYDWAAMENALYPSGRAFAILPELPQLRKFDLAARKRNTVNLLAQFFPLPSLTLVGSYAFSQDRFGESYYGLTFNKTTTLSVDVSATPSLEFAVTGYFTFENFHYDVGSRQRVLRNDVTNNDWHSELRDLVHTYGCSFRWSCIPDVADIVVGFGMTDGWGKVATQALGDRSVSGFLVTTAQDYPDTRSILRHVDVLVRYHLMEHFTPSLAYRFEGYSESQSAQDRMQPSIISVDPIEPKAIYLGARQPGYGVHIVYIVLSYEL